MSEQNHPLNTLHDIKQIMERSSRFISLSGLSGISAGICALVGAWFANNALHSTAAYPADIELMDTTGRFQVHPSLRANNITDLLGNPLLHIAIVTFIAAFISAFTFTYIRSHKKGVPMWSKTSRRLFINVSIPVAVGGIYLLKVLSTNAYGLIAPGCLIFYGLALVNASKYTLSEVRYLGYCQLLLGIANLFYVGYGLYFWALGFGVLHIIYGAAMWWKYERAADEA